MEKYPKWGSIKIIWDCRSDTRQSFDIQYRPPPILANLQKFQPRQPQHRLDQPKSDLPIVGLNCDLKELACLYFSGIFNTFTHVFTHINIHSCPSFTHVINHLYNIDGCHHSIISLVTCYHWLDSIILCHSFVNHSHQHSHVIIHSYHPSLSSFVSSYIRVIIHSCLLSTHASMDDLDVRRTTHDVDLYSIIFFILVSFDRILLVCESQPVCCCFSPIKPTLVFAGMVSIEFVISRLIPWIHDHQKKHSVRLFLCCHPSIAHVLMLLSLCI